MIFMLQVIQQGSILKIFRKHITIFKKLYFEENCLLWCDAMYLVQIYHFRDTCYLCLQVEKWDLQHGVVTEPMGILIDDILLILKLTFRHRASCILGQAFHYSPENAFYMFNQQICFIIWYLLDRASSI